NKLANGAVILTPSDKRRVPQESSSFTDNHPCEAAPLAMTAPPRHPSTNLLLITALEAFSLVIVGSLTCHVRSSRETSYVRENQKLGGAPCTHFDEFGWLSERDSSSALLVTDCFQPKTVPFFTVVSTLKVLAKRRSACRLMSIPNAKDFEHGTGPSLSNT
ncbi:hypothetical protein FRC01_014155, partial [Tulasnella sp. 417]